ncbi:MAG TPA: hypothetical protein VGE02_07285 [Gemmatimonadales bacterium]
MTRRTPSQRLAVWLMAALLALVVGEPLRVHECPMHLRSVAAPAAGHVDDHAADGHATTGRADDHDSGQGEHDDDHGCDCLGTCCTVAPVDAPQVVAVRTSVSLVAPPSVVARVPLVAAPAGEHVLPFAIGPPARV